MIAFWWRNWFRHRNWGEMPLTDEPADWLDPSGILFWRVYRVSMDRAGDPTCVPGLAGEFADGFPSARDACQFIARGNRVEQQAGSGECYVLGEPVEAALVEDGRRLPALEVP